MVKISLEGMEFYAHHGYYSDEVTRGNKFIVDLYFEVDIPDAAQTDDLSKTINYEEVYNTVKEQMAIRSKLLEHAAGRIAKALKAKFREAISVEIKLSKLNPPLEGIVQKASVSMRL